MYAVSSKVFVLAVVPTLLLDDRLPRPGYALHDPNAPAGLVLDVVAVRLSALDERTLGNLVQLLEDIRDHRP